MKLVYRCYLAGPIGSGDAVDDNISKAIAVTNQILDAGFTVFAPHFYTLADVARKRDYDIWMQIDQPWLEVSDCVFRMPGLSPGADVEVRWAMDNNVPVFLDLEEMKAWRASVSPYGPPVW